MGALDIFRHDDARAVTFEAGTTIFELGDAAEHMYVVIDGAIEIRIGDVVLERVEAGGLLGEMALIEQLPRSATAIAVESSKVAAVDRSRFLYLVRNHPFFALEVMEVLAHRLRQMDKTLQKSQPLDPA